MSWDTSFTRLIGCRAPIQQAGLGWLNVELATAVSRAGGVGMLGAPMASAEELARACAEVAEATDGPFGVNLVVPFFERPRDLPVLEAAAEGSHLVEFFYGDPDAELVELIHAGPALCSWQVGSLEEARQAEAAGVDLIVLQGIEAGGHVRAERGLWAMLAETLDAVSVPVVAAGGISSPRTLAAAVATGAGGVRLGTRFVASAESNFHPQYKSLLIDAEGDATIYTERFDQLWPDAPHRVLRSSIAAAEATSEEFVGTMEAGELIDVPRFAGFAPGGSAEGNIPARACFAGESVGGIDAILPAGRIVEELCEGAAELLRAAAGAPPQR